MAFNYSPKIVTNGLVLYLDAANTKSYVSGSTTWNDISRGGNTGTLTNGPTFSSTNGGSIVFDGVNDYVDCGNILNPNLSSQTISVWCKNNTLGIVEAIISKGNRTSATIGFSIFIDSTNSLIIRVNADGTTTQRASQSIPFINTTTYFNVTMVIDRTLNTVLGYYNGSNSSWSNGGGGPSSNSISGFNTINTTTSLTIGQVESLNYLNGNISQVQIYNRALSSYEVLQNYNTTKSRFGL